MKNLLSLFFLSFSVISAFSCSSKQQTNGINNIAFVKENVSYASQQYRLMIDKIEDSTKLMNPKSFIL